MDWLTIEEKSNTAALGEDCYSLVESLYLLPRSITGKGVRDTLAIIKESIDIVSTEVPSGTSVFDWTIPDEWHIQSATIKSPDGSVVVDYKQCNLHVVNYSQPIHDVMSLDALKEHLHSIPEHPSWIPYRTSYYKKDWGFCISHNTYCELTEGDYEVNIDSTLQPGSLTYGEFVIEGESNEEIIFFSHTCHPSLCNDNLSGIAVSTLLAKTLMNYKLKYTYRFIFAPATIGSITWLNKNAHRLKRIKAGLVLSVIGDRGNLHYKLSRNSNHYIDKVMKSVLKESGKEHSILEFIPYGYDERQFCSPGFDLPVGRLTRTPNGCYPEYHTSADNLDFVSSQSMGDSLHTLLESIEIIENDFVFQNTCPFGEPNLGKRGLYPSKGGYQSVSDQVLAMLWVLNQSDSKNSLLDIAEKSNIDFNNILAAAKKLQKSGLLVQVTS